MAIVAFPLDNTSYTASAMGAYLGTRTRGVFSADENLAVSDTGSMAVSVSPGLAWLKAADYWGLAVCSESAVDLTIATADGTQSRLDAVCLRLDKTANAAELVIKQGTAASVPVLPSIMRDDSYDEIYLASVSVPAGAVSITAADITDLRLDEDVCGLMRDGVTGIPTAQLQEQAEALMEQLRTELAAVKDGSAWLLGSVYDPQGKRQDVFAYAAGLAAENTTGVRRLETVTGALETALRAVKVTLSASLWTGDAAPYSQTVAVDGMTADWIPGVPSIVATDDMVTNQLFQEALACVSQITSADGSLTFLCYKEKPAHYVNIRVPGVM